MTRGPLVLLLLCLKPGTCNGVPFSGVFRLNSYIILLIQKCAHIQYVRSIQKSLLRGSGATGDEGEEKQRLFNSSACM